MLSPTQETKLRTAGVVFADDLPRDKTWHAIDVLTEKSANTPIQIEDVLHESDVTDALLVQYASVVATHTPNGQPLIFTTTANAGAADLGALPLASHGLTVCEVNVRHLDHRYVREGTNDVGDGGTDDRGTIVSDVFGDFRLLYYASKQDDPPATGLQQAVVNVGTQTAPPLLVVTGNPTDGVVPVKYALVDGTPVGTTDMEIKTGEAVTA